MNKKEIRKTIGTMMNQEERNKLDKLSRYYGMSNSTTLRTRILKDYDEVFGEK